jgi:hypothetical protein
MLERFKVPEDVAIRVKQEDMRKTVEEIFYENANESGRFKASSRCTYLCRSSGY